MDYLKHGINRVLYINLILIKHYEKIRLALTGRKVGKNYTLGKEKGLRRVVNKNSGFPLLYNLIVAHSLTDKSTFLGDTKKHDTRSKVHKSHI